MNKFKYSIARLTLQIRYIYHQKKEELFPLRNKWEVLSEYVGLINPVLFVGGISNSDYSLSISSSFNDVGSFKNNLININQTLKSGHNVNKYIKTISTEDVKVKDFFTKDSGYYVLNTIEYIRETKELLLQITQYCVSDKNNSDGATMNNKYLLDFYYQHLREYVMLILKVSLA